MASMTSLGLHILMPIFSGLTYGDSPSKMNRILKYQIHKFKRFFLESKGPKCPAHSASVSHEFFKFFQTSWGNNILTISRGKKLDLKSMSIPAIRESFMCGMDIHKLHAQIVFKVQLLQSYFKSHLD